MDGSKSVSLICVIWCICVAVKCQPSGHRYAGNLEIVQPAIAGRDIILRFFHYRWSNYSPILQYMTNKSWINMQTDRYETTNSGGCYEITLYALERSWNGTQFRVRVSIYYSTPPIILHLKAQTKPAIGPVTTLQVGGLYIVVKSGHTIPVYCNMTGTDLTVEVLVNGRTCKTEESETGMFSAIDCIAYDGDHLTSVRCSVLTAAVKDPLFSEEYQLYVVDKASAIEIYHTQDLREGSPVNITCKVTGGRPAPEIAFTVNNVTVDQGLTHSHDGRKATLHFVKREWNGKYIRCQYNNSFFTGRSPERLLNIYCASDDSDAQTDATDQNKSPEEAVYRSALIIMIVVACVAVVVVLVILYRQHKRQRQIVAREDCPPENAHEDIVVEYANVKKNRSKTVDYKTENELVHVELDKHALEASTGRKTTKVGDVDQQTEHDYQKRQEEDEEVVEYVNQCGRHI
ncbi:uncharacterized protein LOC128234429 isoform X2 [Mya arenaria]|uniref:uncharacterized protein LOC128234429 isoform X2 n=1 Tax=Mya arenaria TaxID=6604 RepID=UPI0022E55DF2|nr:uncharacterized protein LOC128234429 isoform X2 [Mya arenaria]